MTLDVSPTKEIKGVTIRSVIQGAVIITLVITTYSSVNNAINNLAEKTNDLNNTLKENMQKNEIQFRVISNQLREQELRLTKLEIREQTKN